MRGLLVALALAAVSVVGPPTAAAAPVAAPAKAVCSGSSVGPGIAPPDRVPLGIPGFHASWYGQSGYPTLCPGERSNAVVAFYNSGSRGWVSGRMGEVAYLGTWNGGPGQVAWFQFAIQAPDRPGFYRLYIRPLVEGATWMEDAGVYWQVTVLGADGTPPAGRVSSRVPAPIEDTSPAWAPAEFNSVAVAPSPDSGIALTGGTTGS